MKCDYCGYEWISVSPVETRELECPVCHEMSSVESASAAYWQRREAASQRMLARAQNENRVNSECLEIAKRALGYANGRNDTASRCNALTEINKRLAALEPEEETEWQ